MKSDFIISLPGERPYPDGDECETFMSRIRRPTWDPEYINSSRWFIRVWECHTDEFWSWRIDA